MLALAPSRLEELLEMLRSIPIQARRNFGLLAVALGVVLVFIAKTLGV